ncbi:D-alanyl-D-alanine carboxypeptidase [Candidatus Roizmanbacteria bacterium]|nr:D-alanyl-D-alanine carboxypeptidase [Candidatus Roizmanbacteria bacterium]
MKFRFFLLFVFYTLLFLFYPGDSEYYKIFAYNRALFAKREQGLSLKTNPVPYLKLPYLPQISSEGTYIVDLTSFTPVFEKNSNSRFIPASTAKIMTALVTIDVYQPDDVITVKRLISEGQTMGLFIGEKISVENLLYGILVHSGNDAAFALADNFGYEKFLDLMNVKAKDLSMKNTHFVDPAGLEEFNQYTTPFDLSLAARELLNNRYLRKFVATKEIEIADVDFKYFHRLSNVNKLLGEIQGIGGLKTGFTENAKENLVSFYKSENHQYIIVILKSEDRFSDTREVISWINSNVDYVTINP